MNPNGGLMNLSHDIAYRAMDLMSTNVFVADRNLNLIFINKKGLETLKKEEKTLKEGFGISVNELIGINLDIIHKSKKDHVRRILSEKSHFPYRAEIAFGVMILELNINIICDDHGNIDHYVVNWEDIHEKKIFETESIRFKRMVDLASVNIMMADADGKLIYINEASRNSLEKIKHLLPIPIEHAVGQNIDIFHTHKKRTREVFSNPDNLPHRAQIKIGDEIMVLNVNAIYDGSGKFMGPMAIWELITDKVNLIDTLSKSVEEMVKSSDELMNVSNSLSAAVEETSVQANTASVASEEINAGVQSVASNMEEMVSAIKEITKTTNESSSMSNEAMKMAKSTNTIINNLGASSADIGNVIKVISSIAQQTNLLALNATIEAARAGEAGKGFAVVANEVKELAKQTAKATQDITKRIEAIQTDSGSAVKAIGEISTAVEKLNGYAGNIAAAVEEQAATTNEVTRIVNEAAEGVKQINENISQVSQAAASTEKDANRSREAAQKIGKISEEVRKQLDKMSSTK